MLNSTRCQSPLRAHVGDMPRRSEAKLRSQMDAVASPAIPLPQEADIVVIGAGVLGLCTALNLAWAGREVVIVERGEPWREASGVNAGSLAIQIMSEPIVPFAAESIRLWRKFSEEVEHDVGYVPLGGLRVASSEAEAADLRRSIGRLKSVGVEAEWLEGSELGTVAPWLGPNICGASYCPEEGFGSPLLAGRAFIAAIRRVGAMLVSGVEVQRIRSDSSSFTLDTQVGSLRCRSLVIAAGAWSGKITALLGLTLPVRLMINMLTITEPACFVMDRLVTHAQRNLTLKQYPNGTCLIGGGWQGRGSLETGRKDVDYPTLSQNYRHAVSVVPKLGDLHVIRMWSGFDGATPDELPLFGFLPGHRNAFVVSCVRAGYTLGPLLGRLMAELIVTGETSMDVAGFDPARFVR